MTDILNAIDAAVESRCACSCGRALDPNGASMWFATPECQWRYQQQHANNPHGYGKPTVCTPPRSLEPEERPICDEVRQLAATVGHDLDPWQLWELQRLHDTEPGRLQPGQHIPYMVLTDAQREAIHGWCQLHGVDHNLVLIDAPLEFDPATNEWLIEVLKLRNGHPYCEPVGSIATEVLRRESKADLPWPVWEARSPHLGLPRLNTQDFGATLRGQVTPFLQALVGGYRRTCVDALPAFERFAAVVRPFLAVYGDENNLYIERVVPPWRSRVRPRSYTQPRNNPYRKRLGVMYRQRSLARRRRNR